MQREYQFKFFLNASHSMNINGNVGQKHSHTWEIVITVKQMEDNLVQFHDVEKDIVAVLSKYQDKYLNEVPPFDTISPVQENLMDHFAGEIRECMKQSGWVLLRTVISENPTRSYMIDAADMPEMAEETVEAAEIHTEEEILQEAAVTTEKIPQEAVEVVDTRTIPDEVSAAKMPPEESTVIEVEDYNINLGHLVTGAVAAAAALVRVARWVKKRKNRL